MNNKLIKPALIIGGLVVSLTLVALALWRNNSTSNTGELVITTMPKDATVSFSKDNKTKSGTFQLAAGKHTITVFREGFATETRDITVVKGQSITEHFILGTVDQIGRDYLKDHMTELGNAEGAVGAQVSIQGQKINDDNPIVGLLPYYGSDFTIDVGVSVKYPKDRHAIALYVTAKTAVAKTHTLAWIRAQGYDPDKLEIVYQ